MSERDEKIARQQARHAAAAVERSALPETIEKLELPVATSAHTAPAPIAEAFVLRTLRSERARTNRCWSVRTADLPRRPRRDVPWQILSALRQRFFARLGSFCALQDWTLGR